MEQKIKLKHPQGKKAVSISHDKYALLKGFIIEFLTKNSQGTFSDISKAIDQNLKKNKVNFDGSLNWYLEWVKLDLEAQHVIMRVPKTAPQKYSLLT